MAKKGLDEKQCYQILGVSHQVSLDELKKSYHQLATIYHPDKPTGHEEKFKEINIAYELLKNALEKKQNINQFKANANDFQAKQDQSKAQQDTNKTSSKPQEKADHKNAWHAWREKHGFAHFQQTQNSAQSDPKQASAPVNQTNTSTQAQSDSTKTQKPSQQANDTNHEQQSAHHPNEATIELESAPEPSLAEMLFDAQQKLSHHLSSIKHKGQDYLYRFTKGFYEKGKDEYLKLSIDIPTLLNGGLKKIAIQRWVVCPQCQGNRQQSCLICGNQGRIKNREELELQIPAGLEQGEKIKVANKGGDGLNGQKNGDLYLLAQIEGLEKYERNGLDLELQVGIPKKLLLSGGAVMIQLLRGSFKVNIPPNSFDKRKLRIAQQGLNNHDQSKIGDLIIILRSV